MSEQPSSMPFKLTVRLLKFFNPGSFTMTAAEIENTGAAYFTSSDQLNFVDAWRLDWENSFYPNSVRNFTNGKSFTRRVRVTALDHCSLKLLDTFLVSFLDFNVNHNGITCRKVRIIFLTVFGKCLYEFD